MTPDARKSLPVLHQEWAHCTACSLSERRDAGNYSIILGEGNTGVDHKRSIMVVGGGPGSAEEAQGRPFMGPAGRVLRNALVRLGLRDIYFTTAVACRSFEYQYSTEGQPILGKDRATGQEYHRIRDAQPNPSQMKACRNRLMEQIYIVDPLLIIALGGEALQALTGKPLGLVAKRGELTTIEIPGAWRKAKHTEKTNAWARKVRGDIKRPTVPTTVRYTVMPTYHPAFVLSKSADQRPGNPTQSFAEDLVLAARIYDRYMWETYSLRPTERALTDEYIRDLVE